MPSTRWRFRDQVLRGAPQHRVRALLVPLRMKSLAPSRMLMRMSRICAAVSPPVSRSTYTRRIVSNWRGWPLRWRPSRADRLRRAQRAPGRHRQQENQRTFIIGYPSWLRRPDSPPGGLCAPAGWTAQAGCRPFPPGTPAPAACLRRQVLYGDEVFARFAQQTAPAKSAPRRRSAGSRSGHTHSVLIFWNGMRNSSGRNGTPAPRR